MKKDLLKFMFMLFALIAGTNVKAQTSGSCGTNATWSYVGTTLTISGTGAMTDYTDALTDAPWNAYRASITQVVVGDGITHIGAWSFTNCTQLTSVSIGENVISIGNEAFANCTSDGFMFLNIPNSVESIGIFTFSNNHLISVCLGSGIQSIGNYAFSECNGLTDIGCYASTPPTLGTSAFNTSTIVNVYVPSALVDTYCGASGWSVFGEGNKIKSPEGDCNNKEPATATWRFEMATRTLTISGTGAVESAPWFMPGEGSGAYNPNNSIDYPCGIKQVIVEEGITSINCDAFYMEAGLTDVTLPSTLGSIAEDAFGECMNLKTITCNATTPPTLGGGTYATSVFYDNDAEYNQIPIATITDIHVPAASVATYKTAAGWSTYQDKIVSGAATSGNCGANATWSFDTETGALTISGTGAIYTYSSDMPTVYPWWTYNASVKSLVIGDGITNIPDWAFAMYENLASVTLPSTLKSIGNSALEECAFTSITLPEGLMSIGYSAFMSAKLTTLTIPSTVTSIDADAFNYAEFTSVSCLATTPPTAGENIFDHCDNLTSIYVPAANVDDYKGATNWITYATKIQAAVSKTDPEVTAPTAVQDLKYSGAAQTLISAGATTGGTLQYSLDGETYSTDLPKGTDAKAYTVYYKVVGNEAYNDVAAKTITATIAAKAVAEPTITLEPSTFVYDGEAKVPTVTVKDGEATIKAEEYSVSYKQGETAVDACKKAGTYTVVITDKEGGNYTVSGTATFTINKTDPTVTAPAAVQDLKYSGAAQTLISAGSTTGGTLQYSLDGEAYSTELPEGTDAKAYSVYYKVVGNEAYNDVAAKTITATIAAKAVAEPTITLEPSTFVYDGEAKVPTVTVKDGEATIKAEEYSVSYKQGETAVDACKKAGTYTVVITDKEGGNYTVSGTATFTINKTDPTVTAPAAVQDLTYTGAAQTLISAGATTGGTLQYSLDGETYSTELPEGTDAKAYTVHYKVVGNEAYNDVAAKTITATIASKAVAAPTITLEPSTFEYDGEAKEPKVTVKDGEATIKAEEYSVSYKQGETAVDDCKEAGTYTVVITDKEGGNYTVSGTATFTITATEEKADPEVTAPTAIQNLTYTGAAQTLITAGATTGGTLQYSLDGGAYSTDLPKGTDAKAYTINYKVVGNEAYNDVEAKTITATIAAKVVAEPTITLEPTYYVCDDEAKEPKVTVMDGEATIKAEEYSISYKQGETVVTACKEVGTYTVVITDKEGGNYTVNGTATFTITEKPNKEIVNEESPVLIDGEPFYELAQEVQEAIKENFNTSIAVSAEASNRMEVTEIGSIKFLKGPSVTMAIPKMKPHNTIVIYADGTLYIDRERAREFSNNYSSHFTRGGGDTSSDDFMELVSGVEYEVLTDGDLILTIALEEEEATLEGITVTEPEDEPDEPDETYPITIGKNNKTTFCGDKGLDFSGTDEVKAFIATGFDKNEGTIWLTRVKDVPAGVPVLIKGKANETYNIPVTAGGTSHYENMFVGNTTGETITITKTSEDGQYVNYYMSGGQFVSVSGNAKIGNNKCYLQLPAEFKAETTGEGVSVKIADSGKSSFAAPYDLDFTDLGDDLKAFTATGYDKGTRTIWLTRVMKVQKGEGLFLKGTAGKTYTIPSTGAQAAYENMIVGNITGKTIEIGEKSDDGKLTNYYLKGGTYMSVVGSANIGNNKSYLQLPTYMLAGARSEDNLDHLVMPTSLQFAELETESMPLILGSIGGDDDETTGIRTTDCTDDTDESTSAWYDMQGRKYDSQPTKPGLYIRNGRKLVIK